MPPTEPRGSWLFSFALAGLGLLILVVKHLLIVEFLMWAWVVVPIVLLGFVLVGVLLSRRLRPGRTPRRIAWGVCTTVLLFHLVVSPFAYELEEVLEEVDVPPGGELVHEGSYMYSVDMGTTAWREYRYPNGTDVKGILDHVALGLEGRGLAVSMTYQGPGENINGPLGSVDARGGTLAISAFVCGCRSGLPPDGNIYLRLLTAD